MPFSLSQSLLLLAGLFCLFSGSQAQDPLEIDVDEHDHNHQEHLPCHDVAHKIIDLAFRLYYTSDNCSKTSNILFSPVSIAAAFTMLSLGAKGDTHDQLLEGLKFNFTEMPEAFVHDCFQQLIHILHLEDHQTQLSISNSLFVDKRLKLVDTFKEKVKALYYSEVTPINLKDTQQAKTQINDHVEKRTHGKVIEIVKDLEEDTDLALMNYISFHGKWYDEFEVEDTLEEDFHVDEDTIMRVPMFSCRGRFFLHREEELSSWVLVQPYMGDAVAFFILPDPGKMKHLERTLSQKHIENILRFVDIRSANLHFPKLFMSATHDLKTVLSSLGITEVFSNNANFSGVTMDAPLKLDKAVHKAVLIFKEKGEETTRNMTPKHSPKHDWSKVPTIQFNKPFILIIKDEYTNVPLFVGRLVNPIENN